MQCVECWRTSKSLTDLADDVTAPERGRVILHSHAEAPESELVQGQVVLEPDRTDEGSEAEGQRSADKCEDGPDHLSLYSGLWSRFFTAVFFLVALFLSGSSRRETQLSTASLLWGNRPLHKTTQTLTMMVLACLFESV